MNGFYQACKLLKLNPQHLGIKDAALLVARLKYPQPKRITENRDSQIKKRAVHLCALYKQHILEGSYTSLWRLSKTCYLWQKCSRILMSFFYVKNIEKSS